MDFLPLCFNLRQRAVLLVGGGEVALRKARLLLKAEARLRVVSPEIAPALQVLLATASSCEWHHEPYDRRFLADAVLVVAATDDSSVNARVSSEARAAGIPVNVVDQPDLSTVVFPAIVDRSPMVIAISSGGTAPVLARQLRARVESMVPAAYGRLAQLASRFRGAVKQAIPNERGRRYFWERIFSGPVAELVFAGRDEQAATLLQTELEQQEHPEQGVGEVYLVGAGPGDPDLLTFRALRLMQQADVVLYDRLVSDEIMELVRRDAERVYVGKARADHAMPQGEINQRLLDLALEGKRVLRLKGGDPFIFGRGGEEIELLASSHIPFQVVPGITAASGCASYAGIPLTHRDHAQSVRFITGHLKDGTLNLPWDQFTNKAETLVFYMGLVGLETICSQLMAHGRAPDTQIALIQQGTTPRQKVYTGTLADMPERIRDVHIAPPTLIIVGSVVSLHGSLSWFEPISGA